MTCLARRSPFPYRYVTKLIYSYSHVNFPKASLKIEELVKNAVFLRTHYSLAVVKGLPATARNIFIFQTPAASIKNHTETLISFTAVL